MSHLIVDGDVSLQQSRPNGECDGGIMVDTIIKTFMHLLSLPSKGYNLVRFCFLDKKIAKKYLASLFFVLTEPAMFATHILHFECVPQ